MGLALGLGMLLHQRFPDHVSSFGAVISAYGIGGLLGNFVVSSLPNPRPDRMMFSGLMLMGAAMTAMAISTSIPAMMAWAAIAAFGGPMDDLSQLSIMQSAFRGADIARLYRLMLTYTSFCMLVGYLISPWFFRTFSAEQVLVASGVAIFLVGAVGLIRFRRKASSKMNCHNEDPTRLS